MRTKLVARHKINVQTVDKTWKPIRWRLFAIPYLGHDYLDGGVPIIIVQRRCFLRFWNCFCMRRTSRPVPSASCLSLQAPPMLARSPIPKETLVPTESSLAVLRLHRKSNIVIIIILRRRPRWSYLGHCHTRYLFLNDFHFHSIVQSDRLSTIVGDHLFSPIESLHWHYEWREQYI